MKLRTFLLLTWLYIAIGIVILLHYLVNGYNLQHSCAVCNILGFVAVIIWIYLFAKKIKK